MIWVVSGGDARSGLRKDAGRPGGFRVRLRVRVRVEEAGFGRKVMGPREGV